MPSRPYAAARLTIDGGVLTSAHLGADAAHLAARVATLAEGSGALVERRVAKVTIRTPEPVELRERLMAELRALGVLATCHDTAELSLPDVEIHAGDPRGITPRAIGPGVAVVEELRACLDPEPRTRERRGTLRLRCVGGGRDGLLEATEAWLGRQGVRARRTARARYGSRKAPLMPEHVCLMTSVETL